MDFITRTQIGEQGQVTLPDSFIRANHLEPGDLLVLTQVGDHLIVMPKKTRRLEAHKAKDILLQQAGVFSDDETLDDLRASIYAQRGRSETE
jgi:bifunctional DNA-binding transcriptional regulator/antitoxin component of YhaV-PrlF toxin-antitoxin module